MNFQVFNMVSEITEFGKYETIGQIVTYNGIELIKNELVSEYKIKSIKNNILRRLFTRKRYRMIKEFFIYEFKGKFLCHPRTYEKIIKQINKEKIL